MAASVKKLSIVQVDVFTDRALAGNALAVFLDGRGLKPWVRRSNWSSQRYARRLAIASTIMLYRMNRMTR